MISEKNVFFLLLTQSIITGCPKNQQVDKTHLSGDPHCPKKFVLDPIPPKPQYRHGQSWWWGRGAFSGAPLFEVA